MGRDKRQRQILEKLCQRRHDTYSDLAQEFHVSERTIMRDVQELMLEYPLHTSRGKYGGVWVDNGFYLYRKFLSAEQREALTRVLDQAPSPGNGSGAGKVHLGSIFTMTYIPACPCKNGIAARQELECSFPNMPLIW